MILNVAWQFLEKFRRGYKPADSCRAHVILRKQRVENGRYTLKPCPPSKPMQTPGAHYDFNFCARLVKKGGRLESALSATNYSNPLPGESSEVLGLRSVRG